MSLSNLNEQVINRLDKFSRINFSTINNDTDEYVAGVIKTRRLILVTLSRIACLLTSFRLFISAVINTVRFFLNSLFDCVLCFSF